MDALANMDHPVKVTRVGHDDCLIEVQGQQLLLSFDEAYQLGLSLALFIENTTGEVTHPTLQ